MKSDDYFLGAGPHAATRIEVGHGNTARDAAVHLAAQLRTLARFVEGHEGMRTGDRAGEGKSS